MMTPWAVGPEVRSPRFCFAPDMQLTGPNVLGPDRINATVASIVPAVDVARSPHVGAGPDPRPARAAARAARLGVGGRRGRRGRPLADRAGLCPPRGPARAARAVPRPGRRPPAGRRARRDAGGPRGPPRRPRGEPARRPGQPPHDLRRRVRPPRGPPRRRPGGEGRGLRHPAPAQRPLGPGPGLTQKAPPGGGALRTCVMPDVNEPKARPAPARYASGRTFEACGPLGPSVISNSTAWPSLRVL